MKTMLITLLFCSITSATAQVNRLRLTQALAELPKLPIYGFVPTQSTPLAKLLKVFHQKTGYLSNDLHKFARQKGYDGLVEMVNGYMPTHQQMREEMAALFAALEDKGIRGDKLATALNDSVKILVNEALAAQLEAAKGEDKETLETLM